jgi:radical SAM protein with 4Fe4S-binding SPASM domain
MLTGTPAAPVHAQVILSDLCDMDCDFCAYRMSGYPSNQLFGRPDKHGRVNPNRMLSYETAIGLLDDFAEMGVRAVQFTGGGEPTIHPRVVDVLRETHARGLAFSLVTNGAHLTDALCDVLRDATWVRVSIDAGNAHTYAKTRRVPEKTYEKVRKNLRGLAGKKRSADSSVEIGVGFVVTPDNWQEIAIAAAKAHDDGAGNFRISAMFNPKHDEPFRGIRQDAENFCWAARQMETDSFKVYDRFSERVEDLKTHPDGPRCGYQYFTTYVGGDGNVYRCCNTAYSERGLLGSIYDHGFKALWQNGVQSSFRDFDARGCEFCQFRKINHEIENALEADPVDAVPHGHGLFV